MTTFSLGTQHANWKNVPRKSMEQLKAENEALRQQEIAEARAKANCKTCLDMGFIRQDLPIADPNFGKPKACPDCRGKAMSDKQLTALQAASQLKGDLLKATFEQIIIKAGENDTVIATAKETLKNGYGWLTFHGDYGMGKSFLMAAMVNQAIANGLPAAYYTAPDLLDVLRDGISNGTLHQKLEQFKAVKLLAIDELDKISATDWGLEKLFQLLNSRYNEIGELMTVVAMNEDPATIWAAKGANGYLFSRMKDERAKIFHFSGSDKRGIYFKIKGFLAAKLGGR